MNARPAARLVALEVAVVGAVVVLMLTAILGWEVAEFAALALLLAGTLLLDVHLPWGGSVPTGYALVIALAELMTFDRFGIVTGLALGVCVPVLLARHDARETARRLVWWALPALTAGATAHLLRGLQWQVQEPESSLVQVLVTGAAFVLADLAVRRLLTASDRSERVSVASAWPVHLSLVCAAALIAMAYRYRHGGLWMAGMAALPLFITRFSFERYAAARRTYDQMIQALGIVPEVAGLTTPGHGERTAVYAGALADELGLGSDERERVVTAARLHHIGYICVDDPDEVEDGLGAAEIARVGADILRETVFLEDVAGLVEAAEGGPAAASTIEAAIVRMASAFDELVGEDHDRARGAAAVVGIGYLDRAGARVARAFHHLVFERPEIVDDAILAGLPVSQAAASAGVTEPVRR